MLLVTGATGYVGAALTALQRARGFPVRATVRSAERAAALPAGVEPVVADLADPDSLRRAAAGCEGVFHLAASVGGSAEDIHRLNVGGARAVLDAARAAGVRRFPHTSTGAAIVDADGLISERGGGPSEMTDPYSTSKAEAERLFHDLGGPRAWRSWWPAPRRSTGPARPARTATTRCSPPRRAASWPGSWTPRWAGCWPRTWRRGCCWPTGAACRDGGTCRAARWPVRVGTAPLRRAGG